MNGWQYAYVFLQSNLLEILIYFLFYRRFAGIGETSTVVTLSNLITHPIVFFALMAMNRSYLESILVAELFAIGAEAVLHRRFLPGARWGVTWKASTAANLVSWQLAPVLTYLLVSIAG